MESLASIEFLSGGVRVTQDYEQDANMYLWRKYALELMTSRKRCYNESLEYVKENIPQ